MTVSSTPRIVTAAVLIIGNEILSGRTKDKNVAYAGARLNEYGIQLAEVRIVPDVQDRIVNAVNTLRQTYDYVFTTGGIGPTHDDITSAAIAAAFDVPWTVHAEAFKTLEAYYPPGEFTPARQKMAMTPEGAALLPNPVSGAPGFSVKNVYVMAGIPNIMQAMLDGVLPTLKTGDTVHSKTVISSLQESIIADALGRIQARYPGVDIGSYPRYQDGRFMTSLVLRSTDEIALKKAADEVAKKVEELGDTPSFAE